MKAGQLLCTIFVLALAGCETLEVAPTRTVRIETDPPGMRIFFSNGREDMSEKEREYVGASPCSLTVPCDEEGRFINRVSSFARPVAVFYADPPHDAANLYSQRQTFGVPATFRRPGKIPSAVFFDMHKQPN